MFTLIVTTTAVIVLCGLSWHDQPAKERGHAQSGDPKNKGR
jgi:hypothetical protein